MKSQQTIFYSFWLLARTNVAHLSALCAASLTLFCGSVAAQIPEAAAPPAPDTSIAPDILKQFEVLPDPTITGRIAFSAVIGEYERILILDLESRQVTPLITGPQNSSYPSWSPDGKQIAFSSDRDGNREIYLASWDGSNQSRLTRNPLIDDHPSWHPDGKKIVYFSEQGSPSQTNLFFVDTTSLTVSQITGFGGRNTTPRFSPDGSLISYSTNRFWPGWEVCFWNLAKKQESCPLSGKISFCRAAWADSGDSLVYSTGDGSAIDLGILTLASSAQQRITEMALREYDAIFVNEDKNILFVAENGNEGRFQLFIQPAESHAATAVLRAPYPIRYPSWTPKGLVRLEAENIRSTETQSFEEQRAAMIAEAQRIRAEQLAEDKKNALGASPVVTPSAESPADPDAATPGGDNPL